MAMLCSSMTFALTSCDRAYVDGELATETNAPREAAIYLAASVTVPEAASYASKSEAAENVVKQLRILAFDSRTHKLAVNKFYDGDSQADFSNQTEDETAVWKGAFAIVPGEYDFFFVANEDSWPKVKAYLSGMKVGVATTDELYKATDVKDIQYGSNSPAFTVGSDTESEHLFLATRSYKNVVVSSERNGKGRSQNDPQHFLAEGDEKVELIRTLAKVVLHFPKSATVKSDGNGGYVLKQFLPPRLHRLLIKDQMPYQSLFLNPFFESSVFPSIGAFNSVTNYTSDWYTVGTQDNVLYDRNLTNDGESTGLSSGVACKVNLPTGVAIELDKRYDCDIWFYVPEYLQAYNDNDPVGPSTNPDQPSSVSGVAHLFFEKTNGRFLPIGLWQSSFDEGAQKVYDNGSQSKYFTLPNPANYSRFSVVRNNVYDFTIKYSPTDLYLQYKVLPWTTVSNISTYVQDGFNIEVSDPSFSEKETSISVITTSSRLFYGETITLKAKDGYKFRDRDRVLKTEVTYGNLEDENVFRHSRDITLIVPTSPAVGTPIFDVLIGGKFKYTVKATAK